MRKPRKHELSRRALMIAVDDLLIALLVLAAARHASVLALICAVAFGLSSVVFALTSIMERRRGE